MSEPKTTEQRFEEIETRLKDLEKHHANQVDALKVNDVKLKQYTAILTLQTNEASVYATRVQVFLVAHSIFMGFVLGQLPTGDLAYVSYVKLGLLQVAAGAGLILWFLWACSLRLGRKWLKHWLDLLSELEPMAFPSSVLFRKDNLPINPEPANPLPAHQVGPPKKLLGTIGVLTVPFLGSLLFLVLWIGVFLYAACCMHQKTLGNVSGTVF